MYNVKTAWVEVGGLAKPSKMPSYAYSLPAKKCITGAKLRAIKGSVCYGCYAFKGNYVYPVVQKCLDKRLNLMNTNVKWISAMSFLVNWYGKKVKYFRWHDSGDLQSLQHLCKIVKVVKNTPTITHWLPTREVKIIKEYKEKYGEFPSNLIVRISATMINGLPHKFHKHSSTVITDTKIASNWICPSSKQGNKCMDCRACWDKNVSDVSYIKH